MRGFFYALIFERMIRKIKKRKSQRPFVNREIMIEELRKDYEKFKNRLEKRRLSAKK